MAVMLGLGRLELRGPLVREDMRGRGSGVGGAWLGRDVGRRGKEGRSRERWADAAGAREMFKGLREGEELRTARRAKDMMMLG